MKHLLLFVVMLSATTIFGQDMTNKRLSKILKKHAIEMKGEKGGWEVLLDQRPILISADEEINRLLSLIHISEPTRPY